MDICCKIVYNNIVPKIWNVMLSFCFYSHLRRVVLILFERVLVSMFEVSDAEVSVVYIRSYITSKSGFEQGALLRNMWLNVLCTVGWNSPMGLQDLISRWHSHWADLSLEKWEIL